MTDADLPVHRARCRCGSLSLECRGAPVRVSVCHCRACQRRSGSAFAAQVRFPAGLVTIAGASRGWTHVGESGAPSTFHFCPECGAATHYVAAYDTEHGLVAVALGAFDDPGFATPAFSVWEERKLPWVEIVGAGIAHHD